MSHSAEQYDRIERYLDGAMTPGELDKFQQKLNTDPEFASAVTLHRELAETLAGERIHQFRKTVKEVDANWKPASGGRWLKVLKSPQNLAIAASLLLLIGFFGWWTLDGPSNPEIASQYFEQLPLQTLMSPDSNEEQALRSEAHQAYIDGGYPEARDKFQILAQLNPDDLNYQLYLGISQLGSQQAAAAVSTLQPLAGSEDGTVTLEAAWYLALAYLQMDRGEEAQPYLERLVENGTFRARDAERILSVMD